MKNLRHDYIENKKQVIRTNLTPILKNGFYFYEIKNPRTTEGKNLKITIEKS